MDDELSSNIYDKMNNLLDDVISDPVLVWTDMEIRFYLSSDACAGVHGNALLWPVNDELSLSAMRREINGEKCEFETSYKYALSYIL